MVTTQRMDLPFRLVVSGAALVVLIAGVRAAADVLNPILLALLLALCLSPSVAFLVKRGMKRSRAILLVVFAFLAIAAASAALVARSTSALLRELPHYENRGGVSLDAWRKAIEARGFDVEHVVPSGEEIARRIMGPARVVAGKILGAASNSLLVILFTVLFVVEIAQKRYSEDRTTPITEFLGRVRETATPIRRYMGITAFTGAANAFADVLLLLLIGVPHPGLFAVLAFFLHFVPALGNFLAMTPPAVLALFALGPKHALGVMAGYIVTNLLTEYLLKPLVISKDLEVPVVEIFLSLIGWGYVFGPAGALLAVPLTVAFRRIMSPEEAIKAVTGEPPATR